LLIATSTSSTQAGTYSITITATGGGKTHSKTILLVVTTAWVSTKLTIKQMKVTTPDGKKVVSNVVKSDVYSDVTVSGTLHVMAPWGETKIGVPMAAVILQIDSLPEQSTATSLSGQFSYTFSSVKLTAGSYVLMASFLGDSTYKASRDARTLISSPDAKGYTVYVGVFPDWSANYGVVAMYNEDGETIDMKGTAGPWPFHTQFFIWGAPPDGSYQFTADVVCNGFKGTDALATDSKTVWIDRDGVQVDLFPKLTRPYMVVQVLSPADLFVIDPLGRKIGTNPINGENVSEVPDAIYSGNGTEPQLIIINNPAFGNYDVTLRGTANGYYTLTMEYSTEIQTTREVCSGTISPQETKYYSAKLSEAGQMTTISWEYVFKDAGRGTMLKVSTDDKYFQFTAPSKDFGVKQDPWMKILCRAGMIIICYRDSQMCLTATASVDCFEFCMANAWDRQSGKCYWLVERPYMRGRLDSFIC
jgi:hypothetical protein